MKRVAIVAGVVLAIACTISVDGVCVRIEALQAQTTNVEQELIRLEREWAAAFVKLDAAAYERIEADDFILTDDAGGIETKAEEVASLRDGGWKVQGLQLDDLKVRVYGDAAVVIGRLIQKAQRKGVDESYTGRFTDTWVRRGGRWQVVASQLTRIRQR